MSKTVKSYQLIEQLGQGGMGVVYKVRHIHFNEIYAMKMLWQQFGSDQAMIRLFLNEAKLLRKLSHPNIVKVSDIFEFENNHYIVMEFVEGRTLAEIIQKEVGPIQHTRAINLFKQMLEGMAYIQSQNPPVLHRDLKPLNILVTKDDVVKITDFGLAKALEVGSQTSTVMKGTPNYMSPEQIREPGKIDIRADIYSLGMSFYVMLCGRLPFDPAIDTSPILIYERVMKNKIPPPTAYYPGISDQLSDFVMKALHPDRESRFAGAQEMLEELNKLEEMGATVVESIKGKISLAVVMNKTKIKTRRILSLKFKNFLNQLIRPRKKGAGSRLHRAANIVKFSLLAGLLLVAFFLIKSLTSGEILHEMVFVKGGTYLMGCTPDQEPECNESTNPAKTVSVNDFYISKYEVTQELWESVMDFNPSKYEGKNLPVEGVSWLYAVEFCNWLSDKEGLERAYSGGSMNISCNFQANGYRLPTEAEWEYAARGGLRSGNYKYSGSSDIEKIAWYKKNSNKVSHPVGRMLPNELGLYDMSGNIWEWCWDNCMDLGSKTSDTNNNSQLAWILNYRALRGGDWSRQGSDCRVSARGCNHYTSKGTNIGFRLVRSK